jgi:sec-independent protein translocase protein TatC
MLAFPYLAFEFWMFVTPGLYGHEKRILAPAIFLSAFFFIGGALFGYFAAFPFGFKFFLSFSNEKIQALPSMREYMSLASLMLLSFGAVFETPLVITIMARLGIITPAFLSKNRKYSVVIIFIIAAVITPGPDVMSQCIMAGPLLVLYEISIIGAKIFGKQRQIIEETKDKSEIFEE